MGSAPSRGQRNEALAPDAALGIMQPEPVKGR